MYQTDLKLQTASGGFNPLLATELALRGAEQLYDINVSTARVFVQAQANTAAAFGVPDWSPLFDLATDQTRQILSAGAGQVLDAAQRASEVPANCSNRRPPRRPTIFSAAWRSSTPRPAKACRNCRERWAMPRKRCRMVRSGCRTPCTTSLARTCR